MKKYIDNIETLRQGTIIPSRLNMRTIRQILINEFENKCAYCGCILGLTSRAEIDQFFPQSKFPEKSFEIDNLLLACHVCNANKNNQFPLDKEGNPLIINPRIDNFEEHIQIGIDGIAIPKTEKGITTIEVLKLNRQELIEDRKLRKLKEDYLDNYDEINTNYFIVFSENIKNIKELNTLSDLTKHNVKEHMKNMLFANVITSMETYLSDAFINTVKSDKKFLRQFVETFDNFKKEKFELQEIFNYYDNINEKATKAMLDVIYHDLPKVKGMYADTLNVNLPDLSNIYKAVLKRHDFVHRNGKTKDGEKHTIESADIEELCKIVEEFVAEINKQLKELKNTK